MHSSLEGRTHVIDFKGNYPYIAQIDQNLILQNLFTRVLCFIRRRVHVEIWISDFSTKLAELGAKDISLTRGKDVPDICFQLDSELQIGMD